MKHIKHLNFIPLFLGIALSQFHEKELPFFCGNENNSQLIQWNAAGHASGIYFLELVVGKKRDIQKLILLK